MCVVVSGRDAICAVMTNFLIRFRWRLRPRRRRDNAALRASAMATRSCYRSEDATACYRDSRRRYAAAGPSVGRVRQTCLDRSVMPTRSQSNIAVVGGGPAGLMAAEVLVRGGARVTVYDGMPSLGRKFLLAGRGGLNLTHSEDLARLLGRYGAAEPRLRPAIEAFPPAALRAWCEALGQATFVGSSGRVFPKSMKTSPLLRAWLRRLDAAGVAFKLRHRWTGWDDAGALTFATPDGAGDGQGRRHRPGARRRQLAAAGLLGRLGRRAERGRRAHHAAAAGQLRVPRALVGDVPQPLRRRAPEAARAVVRPAQGARRGAHHRDRPGRRRHLRAVRPAARGHRRLGRGDPAHRSAPRRRPSPRWSSGSPRRAENSRCRRSCARPRACRLPRSACCTRRPSRPRSASPP